MLEKTPKGKLMDLKFYWKKKKYNPLHWTIHWRDLASSELLYLENPELIFSENFEDRIPFEMIFTTLPDYEQDYDIEYDESWQDDINKYGDLIPEKELNIEGGYARTNPKPPFHTKYRDSDLGVVQYLMDNYVGFFLQDYIQHKNFLNYYEEEEVKAALGSKLAYGINGNHSKEVYNQLSTIERARLKGYRRKKFIIEAIKKGNFAVKKKSNLEIRPTVVKSIVTEIKDEEKGVSKLNKGEENFDTFRGNATVFETRGRDRSVRGGIGEISDENFDFDTSIMKKNGNIENMLKRSKEGGVNQGFSQLSYQQQYRSSLNGKTKITKFGFDDGEMKEVQIMPNERLPTLPILVSNNSPGASPKEDNSKGKSIANNLKMLLNQNRKKGNTYNFLGTTHLHNPTSKHSFVSRLNSKIGESKRRVVPSLNPGNTKSILIRNITKNNNNSPQNKFAESDLNNAFKNLNPSKPTIKSAITSLLPEELSYDNPLKPFYRAMLDLFYQTLVKTVTEKYRGKLLKVVDHRKGFNSSGLVAKVHKIGAFFIIFKSIDWIIELNKKYYLSPFRCSIEGMNYVHICCVRDYPYVLMKILSMCYLFKDSKNSVITQLYLIIYR